MRRRLAWWLYDVPRVVTFEATVLSAGWAGLLALPYCLTCQATFEGLHAYGSERAWTLRMGAGAVVGMIGLATRSERVQAIVLMLLSVLWGFIAWCFAVSPTPAPGVIVYTLVMLRLWWALWWGGSPQGRVGR